MLRAILPSDCTHNVSIVAETLSARPGQGVTSTFGLGRSSGIVEGVCAALGYDLTRTSPQAWKALVGIPSGLSRPDGKTMAREIARRLWPEHDASFRRVMDADRADAALIALAALRAQTPNTAG